MLSNNKLHSHSMINLLLQGEKNTFCIFTTSTAMREPHLNQAFADNTETRKDTNRKVTLKISGGI